MTRELAPVVPSAEQDRELDGPMCVACRQDRQEVGHLCEACDEDQRLAAELDVVEHIKSLEQVTEAALLDAVAKLHELRYPNGCRRDGLCEACATRLGRKS